MRIGFFTDSYLPALHGVEISIESFRKALESMGHEVYIYAPEAPGYQDKIPMFFVLNQKKSLKIRRCALLLIFCPLAAALWK